MRQRPATASRGAAALGGRLACRRVPVEGADDVHHEDQGVGALNARLWAALLPVAVRGRDYQQDAAADGLAREALVPSKDHLAGAGADGEAERLAAGAVLPGRVEHLAGPP